MLYESVQGRRAILKFQEDGAGVKHCVVLFTAIDWGQSIIYFTPGGTMWAVVGLARIILHLYLSSTSFLAERGGVQYLDWLLPSPRSAQGGSDIPADSYQNVFRHKYPMSGRYLESWKSVTTGKKFCSGPNYVLSSFSGPIEKDKFLSLSLIAIKYFRAR